MPGILTRQLQLIVMPVLILLVTTGVTIRAQIPDNQPITELRMPPFVFSELRGSNLEVKNVEIREGCSIQVVKWTISSGKFTYSDDEGTVITGKIGKFTLKGKMSRPDSPCGYLLEIAPGGLKFKLTTEAPLNFQAFGGTITFAPDAELQISNEKFINISRFKPVNSTRPIEMNRLGSLTLTTEEALTWNNAKFKFSELSDVIALNLIAPKRQKKRFELPFQINHIIATDANFVFEVPADLPAKIFNLSGPNYRAEIKDTHLDALAVSLSRPGLVLRAKSLSVHARLTAKSGVAPNTPVLFNGTASVTEAQSSADYSVTEAIMKEVRFSGLRLVPDPPPGPSGSASERSSPAQSQIATAKLPRQRNALSGLSVEQPTQIPQEIANACARIPAEQINDIRTLGMSLPGDQQAEAIRKSREALNRIDSADFLIHLPARDLSPMIEKLGSKLGQNLRITFGRQLVTFCADLSTTVPIPITLKLTLLVAPSFEVVTIEKDGKQKDVLGLVLRYRVSIAHITMEGAQEGSSTNILLAINRMLQAAESSAGDPGSKIVIPIDLDFIKTLDPNKTGKDEETGDTYAVQGKKIETSISPFLDRIVLLVDTNGLHIMGKVKVETKVVN